MEPPPIRERLRLSIADGDHLYAANFVSTDPEGAVWDLQLSTAGESETVDLSLQHLTPLPSDFQLWLLDQDRQAFVPITGGAAEIQVPPNGTLKRMRLIIGSAQYAALNNSGIPLIPIAFDLRQNYPNPFNPTTAITYQLAETSQVALSIYNVRGQKIRTLVSGKQGAGVYTVEWDSRDSQGVAVASGVYLYQINAGTFIKSLKMVLIH